MMHFFVIALYFFLKAGCEFGENIYLCKIYVLKSVFYETSFL